MFDLITGNIERPLREPSPGSKVVAVLGHAVVLTLIVGIPLLRVTNTLPDVPTMMAFVAAPSTPPPPPPPPAPKSAPRKEAARPELKPTGPAAAPIEAPAAIVAEPARQASSEEGVEGGVEGGIPGGVLGGIVGGLVAAAAPPPPPPPPPEAPRQPVRVGGQLAVPALLYRVEPVYPAVAASAQVTGMVILEAVVGADGCVESVKVLRSASKLLDPPSIDAIKQWRYSPLMLNGIPTPFVLTVTFNFSIQR